MEQPKKNFKIVSERKTRMILPNAITLIGVCIGLTSIKFAIDGKFSIAIIAEASLSYVGLGSQPPNPSLGRMLNEAQTMIFFAPWLAYFPGGVIVALVLGFNLMGDGIRDLLDPKLRQKSITGKVSNDAS